VKNPDYEIICDTNIYRNIFDSSDVGISVVNKNGNFIFVNEAFCAFYDVTINNLIGKSISTVLPKDKFEASMQGLSDLLKTGKSVEGESKIFKKDGSEIYLKVIKKRITSANGEYYRLSTVTDITIQKKHELVQSILLEISHQTGYAQNPYEIYYIIKEAINEIMPTDHFYIALTDEKTEKFQYLNNENFLSPDIVQKEFEYESLLSFVYRTGMPLLASEDKIEKLIIRGHITLDAKIPKIWLGVPLHIQEKIIGIMAVHSFSDESVYSERDKELLEFMSDQVAHVIERKKTEEELIRSKVKAEEASKLKSEFLTQISHEIRTPINAILSFSQLLRSEFEPMVSDELKDSFTMIERGGRRLVRTIDLILNMSQIEHYEKYIEFKNFDLEHDVLSPIVNQYKSAAISKGIELNLKSELDKSNVCCDYTTINQIFLHLIENAIKFTSAGYVMCKILKRNNNLQVDIEDSGIGISEEYLPNLFEIFSQEQAGYTRPYEGNGLGLALVRKFADMNKAVIEVESKKGEGSVFSVIFPNK
jgi:PAS domain S-box-containing protein